MARRREAAREHRTTPDQREHPFSSRVPSKIRSRKHCASLPTQPVDLSLKMLRQSADLVHQRAQLLSCGGDRRAALDVALQAALLGASRGERRLKLTRRAVL